MPAGKCSSTLGAHRGCTRCAPSPTRTHHAGTQGRTQSSQLQCHIWQCVGTPGATHVSESVPGSVLAVLSHSARPFLVSGECRACAQQESHDRQQEEEHLLTAKRHRT